MAWIHQCLYALSLGITHSSFYVPLSCELDNDRTPWKVQSAVVETSDEKYVYSESWTYNWRMESLLPLWLCWNSLKHTPWIIPRRKPKFASTSWTIEVYNKMKFELILRELETYVNNYNTFLFRISQSSLLPISPCCFMCKRNYELYAILPYLLHNINRHLSY